MLHRRVLSWPLPTTGSGSPNPSQSSDGCLESTSSSGTVASGSVFDLGLKLFFLLLVRCDGTKVSPFSAYERLVRTPDSPGALVLDSLPDTASPSDRKPCKGGVWACSIKSTLFFKIDCAACLASQVPGRLRVQRRIITQQIGTQEQEAFSSEDI